LREDGIGARSETFAISLCGALPAYTMNEGVIAFELVRRVLYSMLFCELPAVLPCPHCVGEDAAPRALTAAR
jgi:hypothetical protein